MFSHNLFVSWPIILKFCREHSCNTALSGTKCQNHWVDEMVVMDEWHVVSVKGTSYIVPAPRKLCPGESKGMTAMLRRLETVEWNEMEPVLCGNVAAISVIIR